MGPASNHSQDPPISTPGVPRYCRKCGYDLRHSDARCPECGRPFDPANRRSYLRRPPRGALWLWSRRAAIVFLTLTVLLAGTWGYLYWGWRREQTAIAALKLPPGALRTDWPGVGIPTPAMKRLRRAMGPAGFVLDRVRMLNMQGQPDIDAKLALVSQFRGLLELDLTNTHVTDAGLAQIRNLKSLRWLVLFHANVTDAGLLHLGNLKALQLLDLSYTPITDAGLARLQGLKALTHLNLSHTRITDAELARLKDLPALEDLNLSFTQISDVGLVQVDQLITLQRLHLARTQITDAGILHLKHLKALWSLDLSGTHITDAALLQLKTFKGLRQLDISEIKDWTFMVPIPSGINLTDTGVQDLQTALPNTIINRIDDGGG